MKKMKREFSFSEQPEPHKDRTKEILKTHPEVRGLISRNPTSFILTIIAVALQIFIAVIIRNQPWWLILLVAYFIGAFANHMLFVLIHECAHNLIFKKKTWNLITGIIADFANVIPTSVSFRGYHLKHHSFQGDYYLDADLASKWEARLIGGTFFGKAFWLLFFPIFQALRPPRLREIKFANAWTFLNWIVIFGFDALLIINFGWIPILYLALSLFFSIGLHPLGARWIQEHYLTSSPQETYSYYGPLNIVALNVGFHNEHHDFPSIPWNKLPNLNKTAPEFYDNLVAHKSWTKLLLQFLFDSKYSLFSRMTRTNRSNRTVTQN